MYDYGRCNQFKIENCVVSKMLSISSTLPASEKYVLTIKEAAEYFNIGTKKMRRIAEDRLGDVAVYCGNRYLIVRPKFEELICNSSEI